MEGKAGIGKYHWREYVLHIPKLLQDISKPSWTLTQTVRTSQDIDALWWLLGLGLVIGYRSLHLQVTSHSPGHSGCACQMAAFCFSEGESSKRHRNPVLSSKAQEESQGSCFVNGCHLYKAELKHSLISVACLLWHSYLGKPGFATLLTSVFFQKSSFGWILILPILAVLIFSASTENDTELFAVSVISCLSTEVHLSVIS